jgi:hypothetical protein
LIVEHAVAAIVTGAMIILPFQPSFAAILAVGMVSLIAYPYWHHPGSWDRVGGAVAFLVAVGFAVAAWRAREPKVTGSPCRALP